MPCRAATSLSGRFLGRPWDRPIRRLCPGGRYSPASWEFWWPGGCGAGLIHLPGYRAAAWRRDWRGERSGIRLYVLIRQPVSVAGADPGIRRWRCTRWRRSILSPLYLFADSEHRPLRMARRGSLGCTLGGAAICFGQKSSRNPQAPRSQAPYVEARLHYAKRPTDNSRWAFLYGS
jgi:hypothetical protein